MKFLFVFSKYYPKLDIACVSDLINSASIGLIKKGHEVHIMNSLDGSSKSLKNCSSEFNAVARSFEKANPGMFIHTVTSPFKVADSYFAYFFGTSAYMNNQFSKLVKEIQPDVVHFHAPMLFGHQILRKKGDYLSVYTAHDYWFLCQRAYLLKNAKQPCTERKNCFYCALKSHKPPQFGHFFNSFKKAIDDVDLILTPSLKVHEILSSQLKNRIECVPHFVPVQKQVIAPSGYSDFFLFAGALEPHKGILDLIEVFRKYSDQIDKKLVIVGNGSLKATIVNLIQKYSLQTKIILLGYVDKELLWSLYKDASALIVPSLNHDPCPTVVMEAFSVGTPVIGSDTGGIPEMVRKIDGNLVFHTGNNEALMKILSDYKKSRYPSERVKDVCQQYFSVDSYVSLYLKIVENSLSNRKNQP
ncbi:MAG: glycosyltransferase [Candidatus Bathyarchaeota archaeon]|nr:glycosyltransferase [Candidatus Bathyarchaeota archaeon]